MKKLLMLIVVASSLAAVAAAQSEPEIMSYKKYATIRHKRPYILRFKTARGALLYFGIGHAYRLDDKQIVKLEKEFLKFRPTLILNESGTPPVAASAREAIETYGEPGLMSFLAHQHQIPIKSLDPPRFDEIKYILGTWHWTPEQVFLFYVLRRIPENNKKARPLAPDAMIEEALKSAAKMPGFETLPKTMAEFETCVRQNFPQIADWRHIEPGIFDPNPDLGAFTNDIAETSVLYRGRFMVKTLVAETQKGERVFAVVGASHVVKQEKALSKLLK